MSVINVIEICFKEDLIMSFFSLKLLGKSHGLGRVKPIGGGVGAEVN